MNGPAGRDKTRRAAGLAAAARPGMDVPLPAAVGVDFLGLPPSFSDLGPAPGRKIDVIAVRGCFGVVHYQLDGPRDGELCVWVHGLGDFSYRSDLLAATLIEAGYRVLRFDFFGRGWSDTPAAARYDMEMFIGQMRALFETLTLGGKPKTLIGHSMGGLIAQGYTEKFPSDVVRLVLLAPAGVMTSSAMPPCLPGLQCLFSACACLVPKLKSAAFPASEGWGTANAAPSAEMRKAQLSQGNDFHARSIDSTNAQAVRAASRTQRIVSPASRFQQSSAEVAVLSGETPDKRTAAHLNRWPGGSRRRLLQTRNTPRSSCTPSSRCRGRPHRPSSAPLALTPRSGGA